MIGGNLMMKGSEILSGFFRNVQNKIIGAFIGLAIGSLIITIGLMKAMFIVLCMILGYYIGKKKDKHENILILFQKKEFSKWK
jgi:uncharacterized membrane protein